MDTSQWMQGNGVVDENSRGIEKKARPPKEEALNCPRCNSVNTKFCYYNNYSLSQPRYFCKTCRRYWTNGGSLRNVPVGGGSRKNRRPSSSSVSKKATQNLSPPKSSAQDHSKIHQAAGHGLNLGYNINPSTNGISEFVGLPFYIDSTTRNNLGHENPNISGSNNFIPIPNISLDSNSSSVYNSSGFSMHDVQLKPNLNFTFDGNIENGYGNLQQAGAVQDHTNSSRILNFPFEDLKPSYQFDDHQERGRGEGNGNWSGMLAGGSW